MKFLIWILILASPSIAFSDVGWATQPRPITVMVIDTGVGRNYKLNPYVQYDNSDDYVDPTGHGTHVSGIILYGNENLRDPVCDNVKIVSCKYYNGSPDSLQKSIDCVKKATEMKIDFINFSGGGPGISFEELQVYRDYSAMGGIVVAAAGNEESSLEDTLYFPASFSFGFSYKTVDKKTNKLKKVYVKPVKNFYVVQNDTDLGTLSSTSNSHPLAYHARGERIYSTLPGNHFGTMTGTSQAAPAILHVLLKQRCMESKVGFQQASN
jgi:subtilisin family serine protease